MTLEDRVANLEKMLETQQRVIRKLDAENERMQDRISVLEVKVAGLMDEVSMLKRKLSDIDSIIHA